MTTKTIKISEENYEWLVKLAGELQAKTGTPVSIDRTLSVLKPGNLSSFGGTWKISDKEAEALKKDLRSHWKQWKKS